MDESQQKTKKFSRKEWSWIMYDWANSVYATIMMAAVFPIYFATVAGGAGYDGDFWWGIGSSAAMIIVALLAPIVGAIADFRGYRKKVFNIFFVIGVGFTLASAFVNDWSLLLLGYAISHIGFSGSCLIYDSFLSEVTTPERMDKVSGAGYAWGYIGGSTIPFLVSIALIMFSENIGITETMAIRISVVMAAVWWGLFTIPFLRDVHQNYSIEKPESYAIWRAAFSAALVTAKKIFKSKKLLFYILAYFFYIDGVGTVIIMSTVYGTTLGLDATNMILALLMTQLIAFPCSIWFAALAEKFGALNLIRGAVCVYIVICSVGFIMGFGLEQELFGIETAVILFWILACMVGTVQGGIQAISRSYFCQMIPPENSGEFFGFFDIFGKFATVLGPLIYALIRGITGSPAYAILSIILLFVLGLFMLGIGGKYMKESEL
ncbi:MAG: MFS transporter [Oscillospiraceae bacterium]|jgi:UMF1 family MFS transporter|nr:MFS transporter [Oscillospiraceae bacterium]